MTQYFYFWRSKAKGSKEWIGYSVAHNPVEVKIVERGIKKLKDRFEFKKEVGIPPKLKSSGILPNFI